MSKADVYSGTDVVSKRSLIGRSDDVRSHSPKPNSSMSSQDSTSGFEPLFDSVEAADWSASIPRRLFVWRDVDRSTEYGSASCGGSAYLIFSDT